MTWRECFLPSILSAKVEKAFRDSTLQVGTGADHMRIGEPEGYAAACLLRSAASYFPAQN
jgi:hypothetical protein